jgi:hypothetical protein
MSDTVRAGKREIPKDRDVRHGLGRTSRCSGAAHRPFTVVFAKLNGAIAAVEPT